MARNPARLPTQKSPPNADRKGSPYRPKLRRSMRDMMSAETAVTRKIAASLTPMPTGVSCEIPTCAFPRVTPYNPTIKIIVTSAQRARKISTRQPARIPFGP